MTGASETDRWCWQVQVLDDLSKFVHEHGPSSAAPLPVVDWQLGFGRQIGARLPEFDPNRMDTLARYAHVFGVQVRERERPDRTIYSVTGRIGKREGTDRQPRIVVVIEATVWREDGDDS